MEQDLERIIRNRFSQLGRAVGVLDRQRATLGKKLSDGSVDPDPSVGLDKPYVWVYSEATGNLPVINISVQDRAIGTPVNIARDRNTKQWYITGLDLDEAVSQGALAGTLNTPERQGDLIFENVQPERIVGLQYTVDGTFTFEIKKGYYKINNSYHYFDGGTVDLTSNKPSSGKKRGVLVGIDSTGTIQTSNGSEIYEFSTPLDGKLLKGSYVETTLNAASSTVYWLYCVPILGSYSGLDNFREVTVLKHIVNANSSDGAIDTLTITETTEPSSPAADSLILWGGDEAGNTTLHIKDESGHDFEIIRDLVHVVRNETGVLITKGSPLYIVSSNGNYPTVGLADASDVDKQCFLIAGEDIADSSYGIAYKNGDLTGIDLSSYLDGDLLYLSTTPGSFTTTPPSPPNIRQQLGEVVKNTPSGILFVDIDTAYNSDRVALQYLGDVDNTGLADGDSLVWNNGLSQWEPENQVAVSGDTMTGGLFIDGGADEIQLRLQANATQTANLLEIEDSGGTNLLYVDSEGRLLPGADYTYPIGSNSQKLTRLYSIYLLGNVNATPLKDTTEGEFYDGKSTTASSGLGSFPSSFTEVTAPTASEMGSIQGKWKLFSSSSTGTGWKYRQQSGITLETMSPTNIQFKVMGANPQPVGGATKDYYFGLYADNTGVIDEDTFGRVHFQWDSAGAQYRVRGEVKDGTTQTDGSWYVYDWLLFPQSFSIKLWKSSSINQCYIYAMPNTDSSNEVLIAGLTFSGGKPTFGQMWFQYHLTKSASTPSIFFFTGHDFIGV